MGTLELYLIRHGLAAERGPEYPDDGERPLTARGVTSLREEARGLVSLGVTFDLIIASPLVRTRQTAEVLAGALPDSPRIVTSDALAPAGTTAAVLEEIARHRREARLALVGHEPHIGELAGALLGARTAIPFKKGAICRIDVEGRPPQRAGELRWFLPPRVLRKLG